MASVDMGGLSQQSGSLQTRASGLCPPTSLRGCPEGFHPHRGIAAPGAGGRQEPWPATNAGSAPRPNGSGTCSPTAGSTRCGWSARRGCARSTTPGRPWARGCTTRSGRGRCSSTTRRRCSSAQPHSLLRLRARAWPAGEAHVTIQLTGSGAGHRGRDRGGRRVRAGPPGAEARRATSACTGATSRACAGWRSWPNVAPTQPDREHVRRRRRRRRTQRPGGRQPARRRGLVGAGARGAAGRGRRRAERHRGASRLRARHVQRLLPAGRGLPDDPLVRARGARPGLAARAGRAGPPAARRVVGAAPP